MKQKSILPVVVEICRDIDDLFLHYVGPVGALLCEETFENWQTQYRPAALEIPHYIEMLAVQIPDRVKKVQFSKEALTRINNHIRA